MMSDISTRLENLSKTLGLNGKIAKSEMAAIGNELERLLSYFEKTENGVFLSTADGDFLNAFQREIEPFKDEADNEKMARKMNLTTNIFNLQFFEDKLKKHNISADYLKEEIKLSGVNEKNICEKAEILNFIINYSPIHTKITLSKSGKSWAVFDSLKYSFSMYENAGLSWNMIETI